VSSSSSSWSCVCVPDDDGKRRAVSSSGIFGFVCIGFGTCARKVTKSLQSAACRGDSLLKRLKDEASNIYINNLLWRCLVLLIVRWFSFWADGKAWQGEDTTTHFATQGGAASIQKAERFGPVARETRQSGTDEVQPALCVFDRFRFIQIPRSYPPKQPFLRLKLGENRAPNAHAG
jgi:hypothetical protein